MVPSSSPTSQSQVSWTHPSRTRGPPRPPFDPPALGTSLDWSPYKMYRFSQSHSSGHADVVYDVSFNRYGDRLATASADQTLRVWDAKKKKDGGDDEYEWVCTASWKCHKDQVWKVTWADQEYGEVRERQ